MTNPVARQMFWYPYWYILMIFFDLTNIFLILFSKIVISEPSKNMIMFLWKVFRIFSCIDHADNISSRRIGSWKSTHLIVQSSYCLLENNRRLYFFFYKKIKFKYKCFLQSLQFNRVQLEKFFWIKLFKQLDWGKSFNYFKFFVHWSFNNDYFRSFFFNRSGKNLIRFFKISEFLSISFDF